MKHLVRISFSSLMMVMMMMAHGSLHAQTKAPQKEAVPAKEQAAAKGSIILSSEVALQLNRTFDFITDPNVRMLARNAGSVEITGFPYMEKLQRLVTEYCTTRPMQPDDYIRFMLPGPIIYGDNKMDAKRYEEALKVYFDAHPEVRWAAPQGVMSMLEGTDGYLKVIDLQVNSGNYVGFGPRETKVGTESIKMD